MPAVCVSEFHKSLSTTSVSMLSVSFYDFFTSVIRSTEDSRPSQDDPEAWGYKYWLVTNSLFEATSYVLVIQLTLGSRYCSQDVALWIHIQIFQEN